MGNCQAVDAATLVIQHPHGKVDKLYWPVNAGEIMKTNPGHYVALLLSTTLYPTNSSAESCPKTTATTSATATDNHSLRITRIKLLRPTDTLVLGQVYRLIPTQEVMKGLLAKKQKKNHSQSGKRPPERMGDNKQSSRVDIEVKRSELDNDSKASRHERNRARTSTTSTNSGRSRTWQPSLHSISEAGS